VKLFQPKFRKFKGEGRTFRTTGVLLFFPEERSPNEPIRSHPSRLDQIAKIQLQEIHLWRDRVPQTSCDEQNYPSYYSAGGKPPTILLLLQRARLSAAAFAPVKRPRADLLQPSTQIDGFKSTATSHKVINNPLQVI
jgi:hypothetical protein